MSVEIQTPLKTKPPFRFNQLEPLSEDVTRHLHKAWRFKNLAASLSDKLSFVLQ